MKTSWCVEIDSDANIIPLLINNPKKIKIAITFAVFFFPVGLNLSSMPQKAMRAMRESCAKRRS